MEPAGYQELCEYLDRKGLKKPRLKALRGGGTLVTVAMNLGKGWNRKQAKVLVVLPPGFPYAAPDNFWVEPAQFRLADGSIPKSTNDYNPIPGDFRRGRRTTWFGWHLQSWDPNRLHLKHVYHWIQDRLGVLK